MSAYHGVQALLPKSLRDYLLYFEAVIERAVGDFSASLPDQARLLDAGAGEGQYADRFPHQRYIGVDLGIGDTTWNYVQVFCFAVLAAIVTVIWSVLDRRRPHYRRLHAWLRVAIRFALAMTMIIYGSVKVIKSQFADLSLDRFDVA